METLIRTLHQTPPDMLYCQALKFRDMRDYDNYCMYLTMSANYNYPFAKEDIFRNKDSLFDKQNHSNTIRFYELTANENNNNDYSLFQLGYIYYHGYSVRPDYSRAKELYKKAISQNNDCAMNSLAYMYYQEKNYPKAIKFYEMATAKGNSRSMVNLGLMYAHARGVDRDYKKAVKLYEMAILTENSDALNNLGYMYQYGYGVKQNYSLARELYDRAILKGNSYAMNNLGYLYYYGCYAVPKNIQRAVKLYEAAVFKGNVLSMYNLANMYATGSVTKDLDKAVELYEAAIMKTPGDVDFMNGLIGLYAENKGVIGYEAIISSLMKLGKMDQLKRVYDSEYSV